MKINLANDRQADTYVDPPARRPFIMRIGRQPTAPVKRTDWAQRIRVILVLAVGVWLTLICLGVL